MPSKHPDECNQVKVNIFVSSSGSWEQTKENATNGVEDDVIVKLLIQQASELKFSLGFTTDPAGDSGGSFCDMGEVDTIDSLDETIRYMETEKEILQAYVNYLKGLIFESQGVPEPIPSQVGHSEAFPAVSGSRRTKSLKQCKSM